MNRPATLLPLVALSIMASVARADSSALCGFPPAPAPECVYVCVCDAYPYGCHFVMQCPSEAEPQDDGE